MLIKRFRIENYKCFDDTDWLELSDKFNVIVGQNNSGKTTFTEAFRLATPQNRPHLSLAIPSYLANPISYFHAEINVSGNEISEHLRANGAEMQLPVHGDMTRDAAIVWARNLLLQDNLHFDLRFWDGGADAAHPSHKAFGDAEGGKSLNLRGTTNKADVTFGELINSRSDTVPGIIREMAAIAIYVFKAERLNVGTYRAQEANQLSANCENLPAVLAKLAANKDRFERFNKSVRSIFPSIKWVSVWPRQDLFDIRLLSVESERDDLWIPLSESGTGVGQVLAILYVAMTRTPSVVVIDEPNSFLHPGAAKKLLQILKEYQHQYVISTHSPELITAIDPDMIHFVQWANGYSAVKQIRATELTKMRDVLGDLGVSLADVFGYDRIIWVEGPTEQECFPRLLRLNGSRLPLGVGFVAVKQVGDFETRRNKTKLIVEIYNQLAKRSPLVPSFAIFSFDREQRRSEEIARLQGDLGPALSFLPRATYENYLLHPTAIAAVLKGELGSMNGVPPPEDIERWFRDNNYALDDANFVATCDAPKILAQLFKELSDHRLQYRKTSHSVSITQWLIDNGADHLQELSAYVSELVRKVSA
jgi:predicted ATPase